MGNPKYSSEFEDRDERSLIGHRTGEREKWKKREKRGNGTGGATKILICRIFIQEVA